MYKTALILMALIGLSVGMTVEQEAYLDGVEDGALLGSLWVLGKTDEGFAINYNQLVQAYNDRLNTTLGPEEAAQLWIAPLPMPDRSHLPLALQQPFTLPWE